MERSIQLHARPNHRVVEEILELTRLLTAQGWFTPNVPAETEKDMLFQDALCLKQQDRLLSFIIFTSWDGSLHITLMGTHPGYRGLGLGSILMQRFLHHARSLGFERVVALTVPPEVNPAYQATLHFYEKHGFVFTRRYTELWENGAIELIKTFQNDEEETDGYPLL